MSTKEPAPVLLSEATHAIGDRQSDHDHVDQQPLNQVMQFVRPSCMKRGERKNDEIHELLNRRAKEQAANQRVLLQKEQPPTRRVVSCRRRKSNQEVQANAKKINSRVPVFSYLPAQQTPGNRQRNIPSKENAGLQKVYCSGNQSAHRDCQQCASFREGPRCGLIRHPGYSLSSLISDHTSMIFAANFQLVPIEGSCRPLRYENDEPQPQERAAFGLMKLNPWRISVSS